MGSRPARQHWDEILDRWLAAADHIPRLFDALAALLHRVAPRGVQAGEPLEDAAVLEAAQAHAGDRFRQGLAATEVLTEFRLLRQEIGRALR